MFEFTPAMVVSNVPYPRCRYNQVASDGEVAKLQPGTYQDYILGNYEASAKTSVSNTHVTYYKTSKPKSSWMAVRTP